MNAAKSYLFSSESVSEGHPDKLCDQISDTVLDLFLFRDPKSRVACESFATMNKIIVGGEVNGPKISNYEIEEAVRQCIKNIGYEEKHFHWNEVDIEVLLNKQSEDIALGVDETATKELGAGDQGIMFGFACDQTDNYMPATIFYAHRILENITQARRTNLLPGILPDAKSQVTLLYENGVPKCAKKIVVSTQHREHLSQQDVKDMIKPYVIAALPDPSWYPGDQDFLVNPTGKFVKGGPESDAGLTGRKIIVDSYGGAAPHGGGAFSGKDPTKVDRSASYALRYLAKNVVASGVAKKCTIQVAYAIGIARPLSVYVNTHETSNVDDEKLLKILDEIFDLRPNGIISTLQLERPIYRPTACFGHFGREPESNGAFSWERLDLVDAIKSYF